MDAYVGVILPIGFNYPPYGTNFCDGTTFQVSQNATLFSLISNVFGGNGTTTFAVPDLRGRAIIGTGHSQVPNSTVNFTWGSHAGAETVTLMVANLAAHTHAASATISGGSTISGYLPGSQADGGSPTPSATNFPAGVTGDGGGNLTPYGPSDGNTRMPVTITGSISGLNITNSGTGSNAPFSIMQPYLALNYVIFAMGLYPPRP